MKDLLKEWKEFLVEELARDNDRRDLRIDKIIETQSELRVDIDKITRYARDIRMLTFGGIMVAMSYIFGIQKIVPALFSLLAV